MRLKLKLKLKSVRYLVHLSSFVRVTVNVSPFVIFPVSCFTKTLRVSIPSSGLVPRFRFGSVPLRFVAYKYIQPPHEKRGTSRNNVLIRSGIVATHFRFVFVYFGSFRVRLLSFVFDWFSGGVFVMGVFNGGNVIAIMTMTSIFKFFAT